jgi:putative ABC transport system substrate-binding protein
LLLFVFLPAVSGAAQQPMKVPRIGFLATVQLSAISDRTEAFRQGLKQLGYVEGKTILIEWRSGEAKEDRLPVLAAELTRLKLDLIVTAGSPVTRVVKEATSTIPILMALDPDPVANGFVASLARPGGNITGLATLAPEITGKQLELLKEIVPGLSRVAVLGTSTRPGNAHALTAAELAAETLGVRLHYLDVLSSKDVETAFRAARQAHAGAVLALTGPMLNANRRQIVDLAAKNRLPAIYERVEFIDTGGLIVYGASITEMFRRAATYVDKILKGAKPADLPVEQPTEFELLINLKAAKQIGLKIPANVLARADRVIK